MVLLSRAAVALEYSLTSSKIGMRAVPSGEGEVGGVSQNTWFCAPVVVTSGSGKPEINLEVEVRKEN